MIEIPGVGVYQLITSSDNTELEVGVHSPFREMYIQEMESAGARLLKREGSGATFEVLYEKEIIGLVRLSVVTILDPRK